MKLKISRCFDSHLHLLATGEVENMLPLNFLTSPDQIAKLTIDKKYFRGHWLVGFGWDQNNWIEKSFPNKTILDKIFPDFPVALSRADGHALWVNSFALKMANLESTGVLIDQDMWPIQKLIPPNNLEQKSDFLKSAVQKLNHAGITHIRDMSGDEVQWKLLMELDKQSLLTLYVDQNLYLDQISNIDPILKLTDWCLQNQTPHLRFSGVKFYYDGALGSEGALLSQNYNHSQSKGIRLSGHQELLVLFKKCWSKNIPVCIHAIGDQAVHEVLLAADEVYNQMDIQGLLHLEHAELINHESIQILKRINVNIHMQPCHWLTDKRWLEQKVGTLKQYAFQWKKLYENNIQIHWGSDSPIEPANPILNFKALKESEMFGIPAYPGNRVQPHEHPNPNWGPECSSVFFDDQLQEVIFDKKIIYSRFDKSY